MEPQTAGMGFIGTEKPSPPAVRSRLRVPDGRENCPRGGVSAAGGGCDFWQL